ncbi:hypothetical protein CAEBREN_03461 [Caenorhabditis brenneri]|uniref:Uncharacterized protein n=1 Tax=Caenorhabditis brenneri TaxID=135651 RepID=G0NGE3_CAEBE|nr:hypothetical protein CAEBREN_03461 [Caenorhabditis brenneri]
MKFTGILFYFIYAVTVVASFTCSYRLCQLVDWFLDKFCLPAIDECSDFEVVEAKKQLIISDV